VCEEPSHKSVELNPEMIPATVTREVTGPAIVFSGKNIVSLKEKLELMQEDIRYYKELSEKATKALSSSQINFDRYKELTNMEIGKLNHVNDILSKALKTISESLEKDGKKRRSSGLLKILGIAGSAYTADKLADILDKL